VILNLTSGLLERLFFVVVDVSDSSAIDGSAFSIMYTGFRQSTILQTFPLAYLIHVFSFL